MWLVRGKNLVLWNDGKIFYDTTTNDDDTDNDDTDTDDTDDTDDDDDDDDDDDAYNMLLKCVF